MSNPHGESETTNNNGEEAQYPKVLDELYKSIASENDSTKLQKVILSSSYPSSISLKLQGIQGMLKDNKGRMDTGSMNFAIRKLKREETIDKSPTDSESMIRKYYFSTDFARLASEDGLLDLETCVRSDFVNHHHNSFGNDPDLSGHHSKKEVLCIPVVHHGCWSLYAFSISDKKLSILDPAPERAFNMSYQKLGAADPTSVSESSLGRRLVAKLESEHENSRLEICKALEFLKDNFNLFKNASGKFSSWRYEFVDLRFICSDGPATPLRICSDGPATPLRICSDEDSGFFVFNFMRRWDGQQFIRPEEIPKEPKDLRKGFLEYIVSFNCNEVYELDDLPDDVIDRMEKLKHYVSGRPARKRCKLDAKLLKAVKENNADGFTELFMMSPEVYNLRQDLHLRGPREEFRLTAVRQNLRRGVTCDGDGVFHIAARYGGNLKLLRAIFEEVHVELNLKAIKRRMLEGGERNVEDTCVQVVQVNNVQQRLVELQELLRSRNHKGETCLHEAVRHGDEHFVLSLILADEKIMNDVIETNGALLVQIVDYEGVSPLYLATTLCRPNIVRAILKCGQLAYEARISAPDNRNGISEHNQEGTSALDNQNGTSGQQNNPVETPALEDINGTSEQQANQQEIGLENGNRTSVIPAQALPGSMARERNQIAASFFSGPGGKTAMHAAVVLNKELTQQLVNWMERVKEDIPDLRTMADNFGNTPLHLVSSVVEGADIAELLLITPSRDGEPPATSSAAALKKDSKGWLPIHVAAANGSLGVIKKLILKCPECIESRNSSGQSFLHVAVEKKRRNVVQYICSRQSLAGILNLTDQDGNTALHLAVQSGNQRMFCDLMANPRVQLNSENREGRTPRDVAKLSLGPGLHLLMSSRVLIYRHLELSGAHYGTCRRDVLNGEIEGKLDKDKLSENISKSAGLMGVCAIFMLNMSVTTFFNVAKQHLFDPTDSSTPAPVGAAGDRSARVRASTFKALITFDAITFAFAVLAAFCSTFAGFSIMDRPARFVYLSIAALSLQIACLGFIAIFVLAAYLAFRPVDQRIATVACVLPLAAIAPLMTPAILLLFHARTLSLRGFRIHVFPILQRICWILENRIFPKIHEFFKTYLPDYCFTAITTVFAAIKATMGFIWKCFIFLFRIIIKIMIVILKNSCYCIVGLAVLAVVAVPLLLISLIPDP